VSVIAGDQQEVRLLRRLVWPAPRGRPLVVSDNHRDQSLEMMLQRPPRTQLQDPHDQPPCSALHAAGYTDIQYY